MFIVLVEKEDKKDVGSVDITVVVPSETTVSNTVPVTRTTLVAATLSVSVTALVVVV